MMAGDRYTLEELRRIAELKLLHVPTSVILAEMDGRHTADSIDMAWIGIQGGLHPSADMLAVGKELDQSDPGWRDQG
jgi:hypothetical protein